MSMWKAVTEDIWVVLVGSTDRAYHLNNNHTFFGRMYAEYEGGHAGTSFSKSEVVDASPLAWAWIDGFLVGNQPTLGQFLGIDEDTADREAAEDPRLISRWVEALNDFRESGYFPVLEKRPSLPVVLSENLPYMPWVGAGGEIWIWVAGTWRRETDEQKVLSSGWTFIVGSVCERRERHDLSLAESPHLICADCGYTTEIEIDENEAD